LLIITDELIADANTVLARLCFGQQIPAFRCIFCLPRRKRMPLQSGLHRLSKELLAYLKAFPRWKTFFHIQLLIIDCSPPRPAATPPKEGNPLLFITGKFKLSTVNYKLFN
jgi:hypothetical protein